MAWDPLFLRWRTTGFGQTVTLTLLYVLVIGAVTISGVEKIGAAASRTEFSVEDDVFAFPQNEVRFVGAISEDKAEALLKSAIGLKQGRLKVPGRPAGSERDDASAVDIHTGDVSMPFKEADGKDGKARTYELMVLHNRPYLCSLLPQNATSDSEEADDADTAEQQRQQQTAEETALALQKAKAHGWQLLKPLREACLYKFEGWWTYKFCHEQEMVQFHALPWSRGSGVSKWPPRPDPDATYVMGRVAEIGADEIKAEDEEQSRSGEKDDEVVSKDVAIQGTTKYLVHYMRGGTLCDLTLRDRKAEVQYHCDEASSIDYIDKVIEVATCSYVVVVKTPRLCGDLDFRPVRPGSRDKDINLLECAPIGAHSSSLDVHSSNPLLSDDTSLPPSFSMHRHGEQNDDAQQSGADEMIGDILPAGSVLLKDPDTGEPVDISFVMQSQKTYVLASSTGSSGVGPNGEKITVQEKLEVVSQDELRKMDIDPSYVASMRHKLEQYAGGDPWRLEMVEDQIIEEEGGTSKKGKEQDESKKRKPRRVFRGLVDKMDFEGYEEPAAGEEEPDKEDSSSKKGSKGKVHELGNGEEWNQDEPAAAGDAAAGAAGGNQDGNEGGNAANGFDPLADELVEAVIEALRQQVQQEEAAAGAAAEADGLRQDPDGRYHEDL
jgi:protein OS-9